MFLVSMFIISSSFVSEIKVKVFPFFDLFQSSIMPDSWLCFLLDHFRFWCFFLCLWFLFLVASIFDTNIVFAAILTVAAEVTLTCLIQINAHSTGKRFWRSAKCNWHAIKWLGVVAHAMTIQTG